MHRYISYKTIVADPPWQCKNRVTEAAPEYEKCFRYKTMPTVDICNLPVGRVADLNSHLYLWVIDSMLQDALNVCYAWGFVEKKIIVWVKTSKWGKQHFGMGNYFRSKDELCLFCVRGRMRLQRKDLPSIIFAETEGHSKKPEEFYNLVRTASPEPRLEMFARQDRAGFTAWGDDPAINSVEVFQ